MYSILFQQTYNKLYIILEYIFSKGQKEKFIMFKIQC